MAVVTAAKLLDATSCACVNHHALHLNVSNWTVPRCVAPPGLCGRPACNFAVSCGVRPGKSSTFLLVHGFDPTRVRPAFRRNPSGAASTNLFLFVRVVLSLRAVGSSLPITLLAAGAHVEEFRRAAADLDVRVVVRDYVDPPRWAYHWHLSSFNKLLALGLTEYDRVIVLDLDMVVVRNVDILAHVPSPAMAFLQHAPLRVNDSLPPSRNDSWATVRWIVGGGCSEVAAHARSSRKPQQSVSKTAGEAQYIHKLH